MIEPGTAGRSVDADEIARFTALAERWWDADGPFAPLHRFNPARIAALRDRIARRFGRDITAPRPFAGLSLLDIGCGGGLLCEPMARLGAAVTGIDAGAANVAAARLHADEMRLAIDYRAATAEALAAAGERFDVVLALEVVEHVADLESFLADAAACVAPGGLIALATLNRTAKAFAFAILGGEYVLRWLPRGTHRWSQFVKPSELIGRLGGSALTVEEAFGLSWNPLTDRWSESRDLSVNYMVVATRPL